MPELPEVETVRRDLVGEIVGKTIEAIEVTGHRTVRRHDPELLQKLVGDQVISLRRKGKFLLGDGKSGATLGIHLRMSGQLRWMPSAAVPAPHTHVNMRFETGEELHFVDPRTFGEWWVTTPDTPELAHLGPDALEDLTSVEQLAHQFENRRSNLKVVLLDQRVLAGIGNIYADEILFEAGLRPLRLVSTLTKPMRQKLFSAIREVLVRAVEHRGSTLRDARYVDLYGSAGSAQITHFVYGRAGEPCLVCGTSIERLVIGGRSSHFCKRCQR